MLAVVLTAFVVAATGGADEPPAEADADTPAEKTVGAFLAVPSQIDDEALARIERRAKAVLTQATRQGKRPVLVFNIEPGSSPFHQCYALAEFISTELTGARTVAYVAKPLHGHQVMVALACQEIVMAPGAEIGDIGRGADFIPAVQRSAYAELVRRRRNVPEALVLGMLDKDVEVLEADTPAGKRYVLAEELGRLRNEVAVAETRTVKEAGSPGIFPAREARTLGIASRLTPSREAVAEAYGLSSEALTASPVLGADPKAVLIRIEGVITPMLAQFVYRQLDRARSQQAQLIILEIDSPGGFAQASMDIGFRLRNLDWEAHTVAYVPDKALSGAAFVALGCDEIVMHPGARLGDAGPIILEDGAFRHASEKVVSDLAVQIRELAERGHRPPALAEAMVDRNLEVYEVRNRKTGRVTYMSDVEIQHAEAPGDWERLRMVPESKKERFLEITGRRAVELQLASDTVESFDDLKARYALSSDPPVMQPAFADKLVYFLNLPLVTGLLFVVGLVCLYVELHTPGFGLGGLTAGLCFLLFFWSRVLGGTAGWLEVLLFLAGIASLALELFVVPGFGVTGVTGILLILSSIVLASQTFVIPHYPRDYDVLADSLKVLGGSVAVFAVVAVLLGRYFHSLPLLGRMVLRPPGEAEPAEAEMFPPPAEVAQTELLGREGVTTTDLRPAGKARFGDRYVDVVAEGYFIGQGSKVRVIDASGNRIVVEEV